MGYFDQNRGLWIAIGILILINLGSLGWMFRSHGKMGKHRMEKRHPRNEHDLQRALDLSREQRELFKQAQREHREQLRAQQEKLRALKKQLRAMAFEGSDQSRADSLSQGIGDLQANIERNNFQHLKEVYQGLDPEQKKKFRRMINKWSRDEDREMKKRERKP